MARCLSYLLAASLSLSAIALGLVEFLFRWEVKPALERDRIVQERHYQAYLDDLKFLSRVDFLNLDKGKTGSSDAGPYLNPKVHWTPPGRSTQKTLIPLEDRENLIRLGGDWMRKYFRARQVKADLSIFSGLANFDDWDIERNSPIEDLLNAKTFVPPSQLPVPDPGDLIAAIKIRLMLGAENGDHINALSEVRKFAMLMLKTENTQLALAGLVALDHERTAFRYYVEEAKLAPSAWIPIDRSITRRAHRAILATRAYLHLWTRPEKLQEVFMASPPPVGFCEAANEAFPMIFSVRRQLEPRWPMEMSLKSEFKNIDMIFASARSHCRMQYVAGLASAGAIRPRIPGPLLLNRLPYSRKVFGLHASISGFGGLGAYDNSP